MASIEQQRKELAARYEAQGYRPSQAKRLAARALPYPSDKRRRTNKGKKDDNAQ